MWPIGCPETTASYLPDVVPRKASFVPPGCCLSVTAHTLFVPDFNWGPLLDSEGGAGASHWGLWAEIRSPTGEGPHNLAAQAVKQLRTGFGTVLDYPWTFGEGVPTI